jgi:NADH dehydrogenase
LHALFAVHRRYSCDASVHILLISNDGEFVFTPLLHEAATGGVRRRHVGFPLTDIVPRGVRLVVARVDGIDLNRRVVRTDRGEYAYDYLAYALGARTNYFSLSPEAVRHTVTIKTLADAVAVKRRLVTLGARMDAPHIVVVGGGPTGVEVAAEIAEYLPELARRFRKTPGRVTLVHARSRLLPQFHKELGDRARMSLEGRGVRVLLNATVAGVHHGHVALATGAQLASDCTIWVPGVCANTSVLPAHLPRDAKGRVIVAHTLELPGFSGVFIAGDAAAPSTHVDVPMTAQAAVRAGECAGANIVARLQGRAPRSFHYRHKGDLFSLGEWLAGAEIYGFRFFGHAAWFVWRGIYLTKIIGWRNKLRVLADWVFGMFRARSIDF